MIIVGNIEYGVTPLVTYRQILDEYILHRICTLCAGYHWDCSDWIQRSQNPLPNITEVPGSEVPDSSSQSDESNESSHMNIPSKFCLLKCYLAVLVQSCTDILKTFVWISRSLKNVL